MAKTPVGVPYDPAATGVRANRWQWSRRDNARDPVGDQKVAAESLTRRSDSTAVTGAKVGLRAHSRLAAVDRRFADCRNGTSFAGIARACLTKWSLTRASLPNGCNVNCAQPTANSLRASRQISPRNWPSNFPHSAGKPKSVRSKSVPGYVKIHDDYRPSNHISPSIREWLMRTLSQLRRGGLLFTGV